MRFIRKEYIVTTIFNKELTVKDEILTVFTNLFDHRINFSMIMKKYMPLQCDFFNINHYILNKKVYNEMNYIKIDIKTF